MRGGCKNNRPATALILVFLDDPLKPVWFTISAVGTDIRSVTAKLTEGLSSGNVSGTVGFDVKA